MAKPGNAEFIKLLKEIRSEKATGKIYKRFLDDYYALDLLKTLYDDTVDNSVKVELLINLEEFGSLGITEDSVDQIIASLLDIYHQIVDKGDNWLVACQILLTCTSLLVQLQQLTSDVCTSFVKDLVSIVTSRVNQPDSHRLRSCACQCLIHLEEFEPGLLVNHYDDFCQFARQERTDVFQDYALLVSKVLASVESFSDVKNSMSTHQHTQRHIEKQMSIESQDVRQMAAYLVENLPVYTRSGTFRIIQSLGALAHHCPEVSPMIFKPTMLHQMPSMSCVVFHTVLYIQREFNGEILSQQEEADLIQRLCIMTDYPSLNQPHRLLASQWAQMYQYRGDIKVVVHDCIKQNYRLIFYPTVFDPIDLQLRKLYMTAVCSDTSQDIAGVETSILLGSLGCLHKLVWHTGSGVAARALFKALYFIYTYHNNRSFSQDIQRFVRGLISEFAHFIPHSIDFADSINSLGIDNLVYIETLSLLHQQVVMATEEQICHSYQFYLQIMKKAGAHKEIDQKPTLKFLMYLAENADVINDSNWKLGHGILDICRNIIMCHGTRSCFMDQEIQEPPYKQNKSYATLAFILSAAFVLPALTLQGKALQNLNTQKIRTFRHYIAYYTWLLVALLLVCILDILNLFDNFLNNDQQMKAGKSCYYMYVIDETLLTFVGTCLLCIAMDITYTVLSNSEHLVDIGHRRMKVHVINMFILVTCFIINNLPHMLEGINFGNLYKCWKGNAFEGHAQLAAKIDVTIQGLIAVATISTLGICACIMKYKARGNKLVIVPEYMRIELEDATENVRSGDPEHFNMKASQTPSSDAVLAGLNESGNQNKDVSLQMRRRSKRNEKASSSRGVDSSSKESSCHENSGYVSEGNELDVKKPGSMNVTQTFVSQPKLWSLRRRFNSDSELQDPRKQSMMEVCKQKKQISRKVLEGQVFDALESFFITDKPGLRVFGSEKNCELSLHLIEDEPDEKEAETCFNENIDTKKEKGLMTLRKVKSLPHSAEEEVSDNENKVEVSSEVPDSSFSNHISKLFSIKKNLSDSFNVSASGGQLNKSTSCLKRIKSNSENNGSLSKDGDGLENKFKDQLKATKVEEPESGKHQSSCIYVDVDVHCVKPEAGAVDAEKDHEIHHSPEKIEDFAIPSDCTKREDTVSKSCTDLDQSNGDPVRSTDNRKLDSNLDVGVTENTTKRKSWTEFDNDIDSNGSTSEIKVDTGLAEEEDGDDDCFVSEDNDTKPERKTVECLKEDSDKEITSAKIADEIQEEGSNRNDGNCERCDTEIDKVETVENKQSTEENSDDQVEKKEEVLPFKEYYRKYLLRPYKSVANLFLVYLVFMTPQVSLDIYRIIKGSQYTAHDDTDGIFSVCSEAAMSVFVLAVTVTFLWQFRKSRAFESRKYTV